MLQPTQVQETIAQKAVVDDKIARLLRSSDAKPLLECLEARRRNCYASLVSNSELLSMGRSQGRIEILEWVLSLKED